MGRFFSWGVRLPVISRWHSGHTIMSHTGQYSAGALHSIACSPVGSWLSALEIWQRVCIFSFLAERVTLPHSLLAVALCTALIALGAQRLAIMV